MKKFRILMGAFVLAMVAIVIIACTKEKETMVAQSSDEMVTISKEDDMSAYLKQFKEKMQSASKGDESLSLEDARWHLEALLNYTYGDAGHLTSDIQCDTFYYELSVDESKVSLVRLNEVFEALSKDVEIAYADCNLPEKSVLAIQTKFENESKDGSVVVRSVLSVRGYTPSALMWFDSTDYWSEYYYDDGHGNVEGDGKCGPYAGQCMNSGAPKELGILSNLRIPQFGCGSGYRMYVLNPEDIWLNAQENIDFMYDENSPCGYKIYWNCSLPWSPSHNPSHCIPPDDMNYYLSKFTEIMNHYTPNGKRPIGATYIYDVFNGGDCEDILFWLDIRYGSIHCVPNIQD